MKKNLLYFFLVVAGLAAIIGFTAPYLLSHTKIGLEFKGGYEIVYAASPLRGEGQVDQAVLVQTAQILASKANALGISEPDVQVEGDNQIRVQLAGVSTNAQVRSITQQGNLPVKLTEKYSETVGGVLGATDLSDTLHAGLLALGIIFAFMLLVYRLPGLISTFCIIVYLWLLLVVFNLLSATLSLAAIVAFVLGIGIASDANILSYERIKEELKRGRAFFDALRTGQKLALRTILDANAAGIIGAIILFIIGIGPIRGFALTTVLSIVISIISNVFLSRLLIQWLADTKLGNSFFFFPKKKSRDGQIAPWFNFVRLRWIFFALSLAIALYGTYTIFTVPLNLDIDFKAGTALDITLPKSIDQDTATSIMADAGVPPATLAVGGAKSNQIAARFDDVLNPVGIDRLINAFKQKYGENVVYDENTYDPTIAQGLVVKAIETIILAMIGIFVFVTIRFGWQFAVAGTIAFLFTAYFVLCMFSIFQDEIDVTFIAAILTVIGYSINDTIVIFDRIRENLKMTKVTTSAELSALVNISIRQMLKRSIFTMLTVVTAALCLYQFGAEPLHAFALAIFYGLICGTYSSIFIAAQIWLLLARGNRSYKSDGPFKLEPVESEVPASLAHHEPA